MSMINTHPKTHQNRPPIYDDSQPASFTADNIVFTFQELEVEFTLQIGSVTFD